MRKKNEKVSNESRRSFLIKGASVSALAIVSPVLPEVTNAQTKTLNITGSVKSFEFDEAQISSLQEEMGRGKLTARSLAERYLERIKDIDKAGPKINSVIEINPDALAIADALISALRNQLAAGAVAAV
jgi:amidase